MDTSISPGNLAYGTLEFPVDPVVDAVRAIVDEVHGVVAGEFVDVTVTNNNGAIRLGGATSSLALFKQLEDRLPRMKAVKGVKSVDLSRVENPGW